MFRLTPLGFDASEAAGRLIDYFLFALDYIKGWMIHEFYGVPYADKLFLDLPLWVYGVFVAALLVIVPYIALHVLFTAKRRAMAAVMNSRVGDMIENKKLRAEARRLARRKEYVQAADLFLTLGDAESAAKSLEKGEEWIRAGKIYESQSQWDKAAGFYKKAGDNGRLTDVLKKKGDFAAAADILTSMGKKLMAAEAYEKAGNLRKAAAFYEENGSLVSAAECYERTGELKKAAECYDRGYVEATASQEIPPPEVAARLRAMSMKAAAFFEQTGDFTKAAEVFARCKEPGKAAESCLKGGDRARAADYFIMAKRYEKAADIYKQDGDARRAAEAMAEKYTSESDTSMAAKMYMDAGFFSHAAELFEQCGDYLAAGDAFMQAAEYASAAVMYTEGGGKTRAAEAYIKAGDPQKAAELYIQAGDMDRASPLVEEYGDFVLAAELYRKQGRADKELSALQRVDPSDARYHSAVIRLAEIFKDQGNLKLASENYVKVIGGGAADMSNLELYYGLAQVCEADGRYDEAANLYQKILLVDFQFKDAGERKRACDARQSQPDAGMAAPGQGGRPGAGASAPPRGEQGDAARRYKIERELGRGGMGVVYLARDNNLDRVVALKLLPKDFGGDAQAVRRLAAGARSASQLTHPNIAALYDFQQAGGRSFITMEYVEGATLKRFLSGSAGLPVVNCLKVVYQCCQGLDYAHKKGLIHQDIKPSNIMINKQSVVKILDFGLAGAVGGETPTGAYMSPEQLQGGGLDHTTDIYSLGLVFYEMLTGGHPFAEDDAAYHHMHTQPAPPGKLRPGLPGKLDQIVLACLQKDRAKRFKSAAQLAAALREVPLK